MLTFAQPWLLVALGGLIIPVLIHRISRSRPIAWRFPSISKIRKTPLPRHGSRSLTDLLLLLLRILLLALLILALAGPVWRAQEANAVALGDQKTSTVILMDFSSSMSGWNALAEAREVIGQIQADPSGQVAWIVHAGGVVARQPLTGERDSLEALMTFLRDNDPPAEAGNPAAALREALLLFDNSPLRRLVLISDFQSSDWSQTLPAIPESIALEMHRVGTQTRNKNVSIHQVQTVPGASNRIRVLAELMNFGSEATDIQAELKIGGQAISREVSLPPGAQTPVVFELSKPEGLESAQLELIDATDPYLRDNKVEVSVSPPPPLNVLALNPGGRMLQESEEVFFIDQALQIASDNEWIQFSVLPAGPDSINPDTLQRTAAIIVPSESASSKSIPWQALRDYMEEGGLLLVTIGEDAVRALREMDLGGLPVPNYIGLAGRDRFTRHYVGPLPEASPLSEIFEGPAARDLFLMTIRQYARLKPDPESVSLLESETGDPLLLDMSVGKGHLVLSAFPWDRMASDFPLRPSFLPIVREVMGLSLESERALANTSYASTVPLSESVTTFVPEESLVTRLRGGRVGGNLAGTPDRSGEMAASGIPLAPWLLLGAAAIWLMECLLAARLMKRSQAGREDR